MSGFFWIASYPKSGNTWMRLAMSSLQAGGRPPDFSIGHDFAPVAGSRSDIDLFLDVESSDLLPDELLELRADLPMLMAQAETSPIFRKTHDYWGKTPSGRLLFPPEATLGSLYLVRDPRDVAVSYAHFSSADIDSAIRFMSNPEARVAVTGGSLAEQAEVYMSTWSNHVLSWLSATPEPLLLRYEDMLTNPVECLSRVAKHFNLPTNPAIVNAAVEATRFDALKKQEKERGFSIVTGRGGQVFFRQGQARGWKNELSSKQIETIERDHGEVMAVLGYH